MPSTDRKRVRFPSSPVTKRHTYDALERIPRTPSPAYSDSGESDSEAGPSTPPSYGFANLSMTPRTKSIPIPSANATHPLLESDAYMRSAAPLCWDVRLPPSTATVRSKPDKYKPKRSPLPNKPLDPAELSLPASYPPSTYMEVALPQLPWKPITISSKSERDALVTVSDLLSTVHGSLQVLVRKEEYTKLPKEYQSNISRAFYLRCERVGQSRVEKRLGRKFDRFNREDVEESERESKAEEKSGLRRVDCLLGVTEFFGLAPAAQSDSTGRSSSWVLTLAPPSS